MNPTSQQAKFRHSQSAWSQQPALAGRNFACADGWNADVKKIPMSGKYGAGKVALVDDEDFTEMSKYKWHVHTRGYACWIIKINGKNAHFYMHRLLIHIPNGMVADHINGNKLDNRKANLRFVTRQQNMTNRQNRQHPNGGTWPRGVEFRPGLRAPKPWAASAMFWGRHIRAGHFATMEEAVVAAAALRLKLGYQDSIDAERGKAVK